MTQRYRVAMEFVVDRRVGWDGERAVLAEHLDSVIGLLQAGDPIDEARFVVDPSNATLTLDVLVAARTVAEAERVCRARLATAIQESGAVHHGLLSLREESLARPKLNAWAGLRTPQWRNRKVEIVVV